MKSMLLVFGVAAFSWNLVVVNSVNASDSDVNFPLASEPEATIRKVHRSGMITCPSRQKFLKDLLDEENDTSLIRAGPSPRLSAWDPDEKTGNFPLSAADGILGFDTNTSYQTIQGFGFTLTGGSAMHLRGMAGRERMALLHELFGKEGDGLQINMLRLSIGASDLDPAPYTYNDLPRTISEDHQLKFFTMNRDRFYKIPILKEIQMMQPDLKLIAAPWSAPTWMKTNQHFVGGSLRKDCYETYARYLVRYLQEMEAEGLPIHAITVQNEPLHDGNNPSMHMTSEEQADFIGNHLVPAMRQGHVDHVEVILYDHNADHIEYPINALKDPRVGPFVQGSAFHLYAGEISALSKVHDQFPDKEIYFTEQWVSSEGEMESDLLWHAQNVLIGALSNWASIVMQWNLSSNPDLTPRTKGGCKKCLGAVTIDGGKVIRNTAYYVLGHASTVIPPGSIRIASFWENRRHSLRGDQEIFWKKSHHGLEAKNAEMVETMVDHVAFLRPDGRVAMLFANRSEEDFVISVSLEDEVTLLGKSLASIIVDA